MFRNSDHNKDKKNKAWFLHNHMRLYALMSVGVACVYSVGFTHNGIVPSFVSTAYAQENAAQIEALFLAVENNDMEAVRKAINDGASVESRDFNGMQPVDLAIDRGFFEIAHYLISMRNTQTSPPPTPSTNPPRSQATTHKNASPLTPDLEAKAPVSTPPSPTPDIRPPTNNPFDAPTPQATELPAIDGIQEPPASVVKTSITPPDPAPAPTLQPDKSKRSTLKTAEDKPAALADAKPSPPAKQSATRRFFSTFSDFFKPANTTGITRKPRKKNDPRTVPLTDTALNVQLEKLQKELGPVAHPPIPIKEPPVVPLPSIDRGTPTRQKAQTTSPQPSLPQRALTKPAPKKDGAATSDPFSDLKIVDTTDSEIPNADRNPINHPFQKNKPYNGQVDPDVLAFLDQYKPTTPEIDPISSNAMDNPFGEIEVSDAKAKDGTAISPDGIDAPTADPFAMPEGNTATADPFADTIDKPKDVAVLEPKSPPSRAADPLAGLLDTGTSPNSGWDVKKVSSANIPNEVELLKSIEPTGNILKDVQLTLGADTSIGQQVGADRLTMMKEDTIHKPCLSKGGAETIFCVDKISWPFELEEDFLVDTIMYQGTSAVSRYDAEQASNFHTLFKSKSFAQIIKYYLDRFGQPTRVVQRAVAPLAQPRMDNPTYIWESRKEGTDNFTILEVRKYDDARGSFPDIRRGAILLYKQHAGSIFPQLSQLELMVLKANAKPGDNRGAVATPGTVW